MLRCYMYYLSDTQCAMLLHDIHYFARRKAACFNCGGEHILSECQMKKDFAQIQKNRRDFQTQHQGPRGPKGRFDAPHIIFFPFLICFNRANF